MVATVFAYPERHSSYDLDSLRRGSLLEGFHSRCYRGSLLTYVWIPWSWVEIMGLDAVELVMETEDRFDTSIPDAFAESIQTVGDLHKFLMNRLRIRDASCTTAAMFYPIRKLLVTDFGVERSTVRPETQLSQLISPAHRDRFWQQIQLRLLTSLPKLQRSKMLLWHGDLFPTQVATVGDLAKFSAATLNITREFNASDDDLVWQTICKMIGRIAGVVPETLKPETHFNRDLGF